MFTQIYAIKSIYYVIAIISNILVFIDFWPSLFILIPCVYIATVSGCVDSEIVAFNVYAVVVPFVSSFESLLIYVVIGSIGDWFF